MGLQKEKTYMVLNYNGSPVSISTKTDSYSISGGTSDEPYGIPLTIDEIVVANMKGMAFKAGLLFFEKEFEQEIYEELRIQNWEDILRNEDIEDILINPTKEGFEKIVKIDNEFYFDRVYGVYTGLSSIFSDIPNKSKLVMEARRSEIKEGKRKTSISLSKTKDEVKTDKNNDTVKILKEQNDELKCQFEELKRMLLESKKDEIKSKKTENISKTDIKKEVPTTTSNKKEKSKDAK